MGGLGARWRARNEDVVGAETRRRRGKHGCFTADGEENRRTSRRVGPDDGGHLRPRGGKRDSMALHPGARRGRSHVVIRVPGDQGESLGARALRRAEHEREHGDQREYRSRRVDSR